MGKRVDDLGNRMKKYEYITRTHLVPRTPVIIRLDGRAFHTFTRGFRRPFDEILIKTMQETMKKLCENIQGCVLGYTQSDEITLVLVDYQSLDVCGWFDYNIQKIASISASMATLYFNRRFYDNIWENRNLPSDYLATLLNAEQRGAMFDARVFNIPKEEVTNCILWRQNDATRNSIEMVGQAFFSHRELHGKSCSDIQDMLMERQGINWNNYPIHQKRGSCCVKVPTESGRSKWIVDLNIPIFKGEGRDYIESRINFE